VRDNAPGGGLGLAHARGLVRLEPGPASAARGRRGPVGCEERPERRLEGSRAVLSLETKEPGLHPEGDGRLLKGFRQESNLASFVL